MATTFSRKKQVEETSSEEEGWVEKGSSKFHLKYEIQGMKGLDPSKIAFKHKDNDVYVINKSDILRKLPEPQLVQDGQKLKIALPTSVEVYEKNNILTKNIKYLHLKV
ncbi:hypothetical protein JTB14_018514 [Gonioctena quinquepunctata]|nr:hypothetical protein JTB14_018514 [Gonioctena quinquepunctata]